MSDSFTQTRLGKTGLLVGRLGMAASYGAPERAFETAFDKGCNYFYLGSGRHRSGMKKAIRHLVDQGQREKMVIAVQTYARFGMMTETLYKQTLKSLNIDYADVLILGWHNKAPSPMLVQFAQRMKSKGLCRYIGMSGHNRQLFSKLNEQNIFDVFHIRYNPAHRGAETDCFPQLKGVDRPGIVSYTATRWGFLLNPKYMPKGETALNAHDCYRFVLSNPDIDICLCGPKNIDQMKSALRSLELGPLSSQEMIRIKSIGDHVHSTAGGFFSIL